jgi:DNA-binding XRE family transcriptional regulator
MVTDTQVRLLRKKRMEGKTQEAAAAAAGMSERTAREWETGLLPSETKQERSWRTRRDPFEDVWEAEVVPLLEADDDGGLEAKSVLEHLMREHPGKFEPGQLRTLQRRFRDWRAVHGVEREVFFPQQHEAGRTPSRLRAQDPYPGTIPRPFLHAVRTADRPAKVVVADRQK